MLMAAPNLAADGGGLAVDGGGVTRRLRGSRRGQLLVAAHETAVEHRRAGRQGQGDDGSDQTCPRHGVILAEGDIPGANPASPSTRIN